MIGIILRALLFLAMWVALMAYLTGLIWLGSTVLQPMWGMPLALIVTLGGGVMLPVAILFGVSTRD